MKKAVVLGILLFMPAVASSASTPIWPEVVDLVRRCSTQTICMRRDGSRLAQTLKSACPELVVEGARARFNLRGREYVATILESADSDGGDLNDLLLESVDGQRSERHDSILGFNDVLLTLLGGNAQSVQTTYSKCSAH